MKSSQLWDSLSGKWRSPHWQDYLRLDFERRDTAVGNNAALSERWTQLLNRSLLSVFCVFPFKNIYSAGLFLMGRQSVVREAGHLEGRGWRRSSSQADAWFAL